MRLARGGGLIALLAIVAGILPARAPAAHAAIRGGSIVVATADDFDSLDPPVAGYVESIRVVNCLFSNLIGVNQDGSLYPDLAAAMPAGANGGRQYTFRLRPGLKFADGTPLTASAVAFTINRAETPSTDNWALNELSAIQGYDALQSGKATTLSGVQVLNPLTIRFVLSRPDAIFPYEISMANFDIVDPAQVRKYGKDFHNHPLGSGPYMFQSYTPAQKLVVVRNPYYYGHDANGVQLPYLDKITWLVDVNDSVAVLKLESGEVDVLGDGIPKESYAAVAADPRFGKRIMRAPALYTYQVGFNSGMKPFTDVRVRRAVAMAIDRTRLVKLIGKDRVFTSNQRYPKGIAAWDPSFTGIPYDPAGAKALLAKAGYPHGFTTTYLVGNWPDSADTIVGQAIQQDLAQIGVTIKIRSAAFSAASGLTTKPNVIPLFTQWWGVDFPDATDFISEQFTCGQFAPHGINNLYFCDPQVDALERQAVGTVDHTKRIALERAVQRRLLNDVAVFPLFQAYYVTIKPLRLANYYLHPIWGYGDYAHYHLAG